MYFCEIFLFALLYCNRLAVSNSDDNFHFTGLCFFRILFRALSVFIVTKRHFELKKLKTCFEAIQK